MRLHKGQGEHTPLSQLGSDLEFQHSCRFRKQIGTPHIDHWAGIGPKITLSNQASLFILLWSMLEV